MFLMNMEKIKTSITIDKENIEYLEEQVKTKKFAHRSHGINYCINIVRVRGL